MVGLTRIGLHLPAGRESVESVLTSLGRPPTEIRRFHRLHKLQQVAVAEDGDVEVLLSLALADLADNEDLGDVGLVLYAHTMLVQVPPGHDLIGRVLAPFGLDHVPYYGVGHVNCSSLLRAIQLAEAFLQRYPDRSVLVLAGDHTSFVPMARMIPGAAVMGDAAVAFVVRRGACPYVLRSHAWRQATAFYRGIYMDDDEARAFGAVYVDLLVQVVVESAAAAGLRLDEVDHILPHNVNHITWARFARETGYPKEQIFLDLIPELGHTMTTDAFVNLETAARRGRVKAGDRCVLVAVGTGSYFAASLLEVADTRSAA
jgi:3-oxoacyl-[acyl-carrier-protein] synthase III